jgi:glyceraldehyde-3-phosphate dehydrogenase (NADP+)
MYYKIYAGGTFIETEYKLEVRNPFDNSLIATTYIAQREDLELAIVKGEEAFQVMRNMPSHKKHEILIQIVHGLKSKREYLAELLSKEAGKPLKYALGEIDRAIQTFVIAAEECKRLPKEYVSLDWTPAGEKKEGLIKHVPIGLISGIAPFNFPMNLAVHKIAPAIASGNCIVLKPARATPLSVLELAKIVDETDLPKGAVSIIPMDRISGNLLYRDPRFKLLSFTGSPDVGWKMKNGAGKKKIALELGGNAGVVVTSSAEIKTAVAKCIVGAYAYQGQVCIHVQRIYVQDDIFDQFVEEFSEQVKKLKYGKPDDLETDITSMIDEDNAIRVEEWVIEAVADGAKVLCGGNRNGTYFEPTLMTNTNTQMKVCFKEIFGPVVTVERFKEFNEAISLINDSEYGLQAGVFTNSIDEMNTAFNELEVGGVIINDIPTFRVDHMPYGGVKNSGYGREGVKYAIHEMMEPRLLVKPS